VAVELAARGWSVLAGARRPEDLEGGALPDGVLPVRLDVTAPDPAVMPGELQLLVNNAGVDTANLPVEAVPDDEWQRVFDTNVFGLAAVTRLALPALRAGAPSVVCNVTTAGLAVPVPFFAVYRGAKAAVSAMSETLRAEVAPLGVRVVEILPGPVDTDMLADSSLLPEAVDVGGYEALARHMAALRPATDARKVTAPEAAAAVVDVVEAARERPVGAVPLRHGCDPVGRELVRAWQDTPDEDFLGAFVDLFRPAVD
jgi:NAD(P)-dependent dehydrogenase (short-subunit alcohol dehydrogenase family)